MLLSQIMGWQWAISWDNPNPADSSAMLKALRKLGRVSPLHTKTTVILAPKSDVHWRDIRAAIAANLNPRNGNAFYVNMKTKKAFQCGSKTGFFWKKAE